jgi:gamma-glutamyltranspeptidase / glutathione hydrolase
MIDPNRANDDPAGKVPLPGSDTIYLTVVDKDRLAVSFINSLYWGFGSGITTPKTGITLQNRGCGFVTTPGHPNCIGPSKRPFHTIIPAMARKDGKVAMAFGVMGGSFQPSGHVTVAVNRYIHGMDPQEALDFPRVFTEAGIVAIEKGVHATVVEQLAGMGHAIVVSQEPLGGGQAIVLGDVLIGGSDARKDGFALGY